MNAKEFKEFLYNDLGNLYKAMEYFGLHDIWQNGSDEIRCALPNKINKTSVSIKLSPDLYVVSFSDDMKFNGDILGLFQELENKSFIYIMKELHNLFNIPFGNYQTTSHVDLLKGIRKYKTIDINKSENKKYDKSILSEYIKIPHKSMIEEAISPQVLNEYDIMFDPKNSRIIFPHYDWIETNKIVGIQGRTTIDANLLDDLSIPKYWNYIRGYQKLLNLYGWNKAKDNITDKLIIFEGEKSVLKYATANPNNNISVSVGGSNISQDQVKFILNNTTSDCEIILAFDKDITSKYIEYEGTDEVSHLEEMAKMFSKYRKTSIILDRYNITDEKDAPIDKGIKRFNILMKYREEIT